MTKTYSVRRTISRDAIIGHPTTEGHRRFAMRLRTLLLLLPAIVTAGFAQQAAPPAQPAAVGGLANVRSPEVSADRRVTFRIAAPKASAVSVICECLTLEEIAKRTAQLAQLKQQAGDGNPEVARLTRGISGIRSDPGELGLARVAARIRKVNPPPVEA